MPWLTVRDNVRLGLGPETRRNRIHDQLMHEAIHKVGLTPFADTLPRDLSGGMAQRTALARAIVRRPTLLLLDEPFSALDAFNKVRLQDHILHLWERDRQTLLVVTHDLEEALALSDRVILLKGQPGRVHADFAIDLPRPRERTSPPFQHWKSRLLHALHFPEHVHAA